MDHRALESSALARKVLPVSPASLLLVAEQVLAWLWGSYRALPDFELHKNRWNRRIQLIWTCTMSVAGLKCGPDHGSNRAPMETRSLLSTTVMLHPIWELCTLLRVELLEAQEAAVRTAAVDLIEGSGMTNGQCGGEEEEFPPTKAPSKRAKQKKPYDPDRDASRDHYTLVSKIMEGQRWCLLDRQRHGNLGARRQRSSQSRPEGEGEHVPSSKWRGQGVVSHGQRGLESWPANLPNQWCHTLTEDAAGGEWSQCLPTRFSWANQCVPNSWLNSPHQIDPPQGQRQR